MEEHSERPPSKDRTFPSQEEWFRRRLKSADNPEDTLWRQSRTNFHSTSKSHRPQNGAITQTAKILKKSGGKSTASNRSKPSSNPAERVTSISTFEMKLSDFPELSDFTTASSLHQDMTFDADVGRRSSPFLNKKCQTATKAKPKTAKVFTKTECVPNADQCCESSYLTGSSAQSWAIVASQPPKVIQRSPGTHTSSQEDLSALTTEQRTDRKKRKKKKKPKLSSQKTEECTEDRLMPQEPPKFEDEEEFPDLSLTFEPRGQSVAQKDRNLEMKDQPTTSSSASISSKKTQTSQKKSKVPVQLDLGNMLAVLEQQQQSQKSKQIQRPVTLSVGGAVPVVHKEPSVQKKVWLQEKTPHNPLDSTCPLVKKGKQREVPKAKKPTPLKRVILREREERKQSRLLEERDPLRVASEETEQASSNTENAADTKPPDAEEELDQTDTRDSSGCDDEEPDSAAPASMCEQPLEISVIESETLPSCNSTSQPSLPKIHSRKFRDYCNQVLSKDVDECVSSLLKELVRFQDRLYQKDPMKARMKRRLVMGLREVLKHLKLRKVKCVIISPNCERIQSKGGLDEALHTIIDTCREQGVPFVFALSRKVLGRCVNKSVPVSLVGIFNYDGAQDHFHKMIELSAEARKSYEVMIAKLSSEEPLEPETPQELPEEPSGAEEPEYIKIWKRMLEQDYHSLLGLEDQFSTVSISSE